MKTFGLFIIVLCISFRAFATPQIPDKLIYNGKEYHLLSFPLEKYFEKHPEKRPFQKGSSTGLWRGYIATFEIKNNQLYLKDIGLKVFGSKSDQETYKSVIHNIFPNQKEIKADWITGVLEISSGKSIFIEGHGYGQTDYANYIMQEFDRGVLKKEVHLKQSQLGEFKEKQYQAFIKTDEYKKLAEKFKNRHGSFESVVRFDLWRYSTKILVEEPVASDR